MTDSNSIGRRQLLTAGVAGVLGAAAGFLVGREIGDAGSPASNGESDAAHSGATEFNWSLTVQGGYGWLFTKENGKTYVKVLALDKNQCACGTNADECIDHPMKLFVDAKLTDIEVRNGTAPDPDVNGICEWTLGNATFVDMPGAGVREGRRSTWASDALGPIRPDQEELWDDQIWLPERVSAGAQAANLASASLKLTDGDLSVRPPTNRFARWGTWQFATNGTPRHKALTDVLRLTGSASQSLVLNNSVGTRTEQIILKPKSIFLPIEVRSAKTLKPHTPIEGGALKHYARLFTFTNVDCEYADVPTYHSRMKLPMPQMRMSAESDPSALTPGDLCPPLPLDG